MSMPARAKTVEALRANEDREIQEETVFWVGRSGSICSLGRSTRTPPPTLTMLRRLLTSAVHLLPSPVHEVALGVPRLTATLGAEEL